MVASITSPVALPCAFAENSVYKNVIPEDPTGTYLASWKEGFPALTMDISLEAVPPAGQDFNGVLNAMSSYIFAAQNGYFPTFSATVSEKIGGYPADAVLVYITPTKCTLVRSLIANNTYNFVSNPEYIDGEKWVEINPSNSDFDLFDFKWRDATTTNPLWKLSDGNWINKADAPLAYQHLVEDFNNITQLWTIDLGEYGIFVRDSSHDHPGYASPYTYKNIDPNAAQVYVYAQVENPTTEEVWNNHLSNAYGSSGLDLGIPISAGYEPQQQTETIAGITIQYYLGADEHKIILPDQETAAADIFNATGTAWYYVLDLTNERFKLPRKRSTQIVASVETTNNDGSSSYYRLYADGWIEQGGKNIISSGSDTISVTYPEEMAEATIPIIGDEMNYETNPYVYDQQTLSSTTTGFSCRGRWVSRDNSGWENTSFSWKVSGKAARDMSSFQANEKYIYFYIK